MSIHKIENSGGTAYQVMLRIGRKQIGRRFERKLDAVAWEQEQLTIGRDGSVSKPENLAMTVLEMANYWFENYALLHKEPSSCARDRAIIRTHIAPYLGNRRAADIESLEIERWLAILRNEVGLAPKSCNDCLGLLRKIFADALRWRFVRDNPVLGIRPFRIPQQDMDFWTEDEADAFLAYMRACQPRHFPAFALALHTGMRAGEIGGLQWDAVDINRRMITVKRSYCDKLRAIKEVTKSKRVRHIPVNSILLDVLCSARQSAIGNRQSAIGNRQSAPGPLISDIRKDVHRLSYLLRRFAKLAGVRGIRFHDLRHTFASQFMMRGGNIYDLKRILGHTVKWPFTKFA